VDIARTVQAQVFFPEPKQLLDLPAGTCQDDGIDIGALSDPLERCQRLHCACHAGCDGHSPHERKPTNAGQLQSNRVWSGRARLPILGMASSCSR
jgi:hypothetical protein